MPFDVEAEIKPETKIAKARWGATVELKYLKDSRGDAHRMETSSELIKPLSDARAVLLVTFGVAITLAWVYFMGWAAIRLWHMS